MPPTEPHATGILKDVFEISTTKQVVVIIQDVEGDMPANAVLHVADQRSAISGVDYPRTIVDLPDGSRGLDFSILGVLLKSGSKADWEPYKGQRAEIFIKS